jgi:hypothetical protein
VNVDSILLSEFAKVEQSGNLTVVSAFNALGGPGPAWGLPLMAISLVIHGHRDEAGTEHRAVIRLINARREQVIPEELSFDFQFREDDGSLEEGMPLRHTAVFMLGGVAFTEPGPYAFEIYIDGTYHAAATLFVRQQSK